MRGLARQRFLLPVFILSGMNLVLPVFGEAVAEISSEKDAAVDADARLVRVEEFRALEAAFADLSSQLAAWDLLAITYRCAVSRRRSSVRRRLWPE